MKRMTCNRCGKEPHELKEYQTEAKFDYQDEALNDDHDKWDSLPQEEKDHIIDQWTWYNEGTMNWENGHYLCTYCYLLEGSPSDPKGWVAP